MYIAAAEILKLQFSKDFGTNTNVEESVSCLKIMRREVKLKQNQPQTWMEVWLQSGSEWTPNWTNPGLFQIRFQYRFQFGVQSDPLWSQTSIHVCS